MGSSSSAPIASETASRRGTTSRRSCSGRTAECHDSRLAPTIEVTNVVTPRIDCEQQYGQRAGDDAHRDERGERGEVEAARLGDRGEEERQAAQVAVGPLEQARA